ncbi:MAG: ABC transporter ATP-binding protein [Chloroflexi bacterium]|nr:ABC transporter ATP-binding protein [Chloroflexota bacterium]MCC6896848.1 ABC transporter ATP-binding protein [Anaerolineae bacterium]
MPLAYEVQHLTRFYPKQTAPANDDISLTVDNGEIFGLLGDNGAGKTTLVKQMAYLLKPTQGSITLFGQPLRTDNSASKIGYMPQTGMALNNLTVGEAFYFTAHLRGFSRSDARAERDYLLALLDLGSLRDQPIPRLSGGQKRMVALASTLAASPPVIILDEPTNDLDPQNRQRVWDILRNVNADRGTTVILVTHNVLEAEKVVQRVGIMQHGKLVSVGRPGILKGDLNRQLRLEVVFSPEAPPAFPPDVQPIVLAAGRWLLLIDRDQAPAYLTILNRTPSIEDFRLSTATLEDLYMAMVD